LLKEGAEYRAGAKGLPALVADLLFVIFNDFGGTHFCLVRFLAKFSKSAALTQEIPALIELDFQFGEALLVADRKFPFAVEAFFFSDEFVDVVEYGLIFVVVCHGLLRIRLH
jgi:hypothetical protein